MANNLFKAEYRELQKTQKEKKKKKKHKDFKGGESRGGNEKPLLFQNPVGHYHRRLKDRGRLKKN